MQNTTPRRSGTALFTPARAITRTLRSHLGRALRELASWRTLILIGICALLAIPATLFLAPDHKVHTLGQTIAVKSQPADTSFSGYGQITEGPRTFDLPHMRIYGPIRPQLSLVPQSSEELTNLLRPGTSAQTATAPPAPSSWDSWCGGPKQRGCWWCLSFCSHLQAGGQAPDSSVEPAKPLKLVKQLGTSQLIRSWPSSSVFSHSGWGPPSRRLSERTGSPMSTVFPTSSAAGTWH